MKDRFKFRFFDVENKKMYDVKNICFVGEPTVTVDYKPVIKKQIYKGYLIQCTGLKDKNGKLIYEGDIIKIEYYDYGIKYRIGVVEWEDDGFCVTYHNAKDTKVSGCSLVDIVNGDKQEVIGNIFQDKELMNEA
nr:MAG TPA: YopX protein [Caudoviricetes sp.]